MIPTQEQSCGNVAKRKHRLNWNHYMFTLYTVNQFTKKHPAFTLGGLRSLIFNESINGLASSGAIVRIGRKVLIDEAKFFHWIESQQTSAKK